MPGQDSRAGKMAAVTDQAGGYAEGGWRDGVTCKHAEGTTRYLASGCHALDLRSNAQSTKSPRAPEGVAREMERGGGLSEF